MVYPVGNSSISAGALREEAPPLTESRLHSLVWDGNQEQYSTEIMQQITCLEMPQFSSRSSSPTNDPEAFFASLEISQEVVDAFEKSDIEHIKSLFQKHPISNCICFHDLFGLEFFQIIESWKPLLSEESFQQIREEWDSLFVSAYLGLLRGYPPHPVSSKKLPRVVDRDAYLEGLNHFFYNTLEKVMDAGLNAEDSIQRVLSPWVKTKTVFEKFLRQDSYRELLMSIRLIRCPSVLEIVSDNLKEALDNFKSYAALMRASFPRELSGTLFENIASFQFGADVTLYQDLLQEVLSARSHIQLQAALGSEKQKLMEIEHLPRDRNRLLQEELLSRKQLQAALLICWFDDLKAIIEHLIMAKKPSLLTAITYANRGSVTLCKVLNCSRSYQEGLEPASQLDKALSEITSQCNRQILESDLLKYNYEVADLHASPTFSSLSRISYEQERESYLNVYTFIQQIVTAALKKLSEIPVSECRGQPLLDKTIFLSRLLVLLHDIGVGIGEVEATEENILPQAFLDFLSRENAEEELIIAEPAPAESLQETPVSIFLEASEILGARKRRHLERVLQKLGLEPVRQKGSHIVYQYEDGNTAATVPAHKEIASGTLRSIRDQVESWQQKRSENSLR